MPKIQAAVKIAREIHNIENNTANILSILNTIIIREKTIRDMKEKLQKRGKDIDLITYVKMIVSMRNLALQVLEFIQIWKTEMNTNEEFI